MKATRTSETSSIPSGDPEPGIPSDPGHAQRIAVVDLDRCAGCGLCTAACPEDAIVMGNAAVIVEDRCIGCGSCVMECPNGAISLSPAAIARPNEQREHGENPMTTREYVLQADDGTFEETVVRSSVPVLVDFWAPWCGPCHMVAPVVEELSREHHGRVKFVKVDVDQARRTAMSLGIMSIPTLILFSRGKPVSQQIGAQPKAVLKEMIQKSLGERG